METNSNGLCQKACYTCARTIKPEAYLLGNQEANARYHIGSWSITNQTMEEFQKILKNANQSSIVVLTYHHITDGYSVETSTSVKNFREQMRYLKENNFQVVILSELLDHDEKPSWNLYQPTLIAIGILAAACPLIALRKLRRKGITSHERVYPCDEHRSFAIQFGTRASG